MRNGTGGPGHSSWPIFGAILLSLAVLVTSSCGGGDDERPQTQTPSGTPSRIPERTATASPSPREEPQHSAAPASPDATPAGTPGSIPEPVVEQPPSQVGLLTVIDKQSGLPADYVPPDLAPLGAAYLAPGFGGSLRAEAKAALERMLSDAYDQGHDMYSRSAYRSYAEQERTFAHWVSALGEDEARRVSAEAGHSEHQMGTAVDLTNADVGYDLTEPFGETPGGRWLAENGHRYGFALSYPAEAEAVTGYAYEPWHYRYIGPEHAAAWEASGVTLGEYLRGLEG